MMFQPKSNRLCARKICLHIIDAESPADKFRFTKDIATSADVVSFINRLEGESLSQIESLAQNIQTAPEKNSHLEPYRVIIGEFMRQVKERQASIDYHDQMFHFLDPMILKEIFPLSHRNVSKKGRGEPI
jgi:septation ring formation regulator EzrA